MSKQTALFLTEAQVAERMGLTVEQFKAALPALRQAGFPEPDTLLANRRYWPACQAFLDRRYGLASSSMSTMPVRDGEEKWD